MSRTQGPDPGRAERPRVFRRSRSPRGRDGPNRQGAFDIRNFIGILLGLFGLALLGAGIFAFTPEAAAKTGGVNANLWAGLAMVDLWDPLHRLDEGDPIRMVVRDNEDGAEEPRDIAALELSCGGPGPGPLHATRWAPAIETTDTCHMADIGGLAGPPPRVTRLRAPGLSRPSARPPRVTPLRAPGLSRTTARPQRPGAPAQRPGAPALAADSPSPAADSSGRSPREGSAPLA